MKTITTLLATLLVFGTLSYGQNCTLSGKVTDIQTGKAISYANVGLFRDGMLVTGVSADEDGTYLMNVLQPGDYEVRVSFFGNDMQRIPVVKLREDQAKEMNYFLSRPLNDSIVLSQPEYAGMPGRQPAGPDSAEKSPDQWKFYKKY
ncbi:MAG: carboxypeptidase-like regulatory domain-containing protein [Bacteroidales bacterium]